MDFAKKHYEKIILSAVLLGVVGFLVFLPFVIKHDQEELKRVADAVISGSVKPLPPLDLTREAAALQRVQSPARFDFSTTNRLFNPLEWKKAADGTLFPIRSGNEIGANAAVVTKITPLNLIITFDSAETNGTVPRYVIGVERQSADKPAQRRKQQRYVSLGEKKDAFILSEVKGDPADPSGLVLKLTDSGETVTISKDVLYQRVDAYTADLKYDLEKKNFPGRRVGSTLSFGGEDYIVVAVDVDEVILSAQSNQKKTTLRYAP
ncbi:MAG: hypothetical protein WDM80_06280 [Limisphaerales bacterium]